MEQSTKSIVSANTMDCFKNRLDKLWSSQDMIFDYKAELTGIGNSAYSSDA